MGILFNPLSPTYCNPNASLPYYNKADRDRAAIGYEYEVVTDGTNPKDNWGHKSSWFARSVINEMANHHRTVRDAIHYAYHHVAAPICIVRDKNNQIILKEKWPRIDGDPKMTLCGLYGNYTNGPPDNSGVLPYQWYAQDVDKAYNGSR